MKPGNSGEEYAAVNDPLGIREKLAALEHDQWLHWSKTVAESVAPEKVKEWEPNWIPYEKLTEEAKNQDREWADKVLAIIQDNIEVINEPGNGNKGK